ncbi:hypothetical protein Pcar_3264 [Syntrophotalea carbinolica DSM 2380]|uniref:Uncharacterized protein n=1 Tax=Syntrophotalea carbinolica (strain DSM 2380 / NBRC 103641 / GraBd1) TaxID=338963 RepID=Q0C6Q3_SYNC1|nr:hypothetical protein Pcar_3264 [Syntrophotalea carbinolica DSM 2380]
MNMPFEALVCRCVPTSSRDTCILRRSIGEVLCIKSEVTNGVDRRWNVCVFFQHGCLFFGHFCEFYGLPK